MACSAMRRPRPSLPIISLWSLVSVASRDACADARHEPIAEMVAKTGGRQFWRQIAGQHGNRSNKHGQGSGFSIDRVGHIAANRHVVDGAIPVFVHTADGVRCPATIVGIQDKSGMALPRIGAGPALPFV